MSPVRLFVDDERSAYHMGWTLARTPHEAIYPYFDLDSDYDIQALSLDWYMGNTLDGIAIAKEMINRVELLDLPVFKNLSLVICHSSDREKAIQQAQLFEQAKKDGIVPSSCRTRLNEDCRIDFSFRD